MLEEFKKFAMRGNVVDLAVGVIIGAAFGAIVSSLVGDIIMPLIGSITGGLDFSNYFIPLSAEGDRATALADAKKAGRGPRLGQLSHHRHQLSHHRLRAISRDQGHQSPEESTKLRRRRRGPSEEVKLLTEIRDALKSR